MKIVLTCGSPKESQASPGGPIPHLENPEPAFLTSTVMAHSCDVPDTFQLALLNEGRKCAEAQYAF